jgi:DNA-binding transcriptional regulator YiaG
MNFIENYIEQEVTRQINQRLAETGKKEVAPVEPKTAMGQKELAKYYGVSNVTVCRWQREGRLKGCYTKLGRKICYDINKLDKKFGG